MQQFGKNGHIPYEGFKEFMIGVLGVSDTKDDILHSFKLINKGGDVGTIDRMELVSKGRLYILFWLSLILIYLVLNR